MSNLTISVDDQLIKQARVRAIQQGTSLSAKVREFLLTYVNESGDALVRARQESTARLMAAIHATTSKAPGSARRGTLRETLYETDFRTRDRAATRAAKSVRRGR